MWQAKSKGSSKNRFLWMRRRDIPGDLSPAGHVIYNIRTYLPYI
jgi:hypothetical protein